MRNSLSSTTSKARSDHRSAPCTVPHRERFTNDCRSSSSCRAVYLWPELASHERSLLYRTSLPFRSRTPNVDQAFTHGAGAGGFLENLQFALQLHSVEKQR